jgi:translation initiation factor RLI1
MCSSLSRLRRSRTTLYCPLVPLQACACKHVLTVILADAQVKDLSGGELQRVAITLALGKPADIYLIDEPSAYLDSEQRLNAAKVRACV